MNVLLKLVLFGGGAAIAAACTAEAYAQLVQGPAPIVSLPPARHAAIQLVAPPRSAAHP